MKKTKIGLVMLLLSSLILTSCAADKMMHISGESYLHKDSTDVRVAHVVENQLGLASLGKNTKNYNAYFLARTSLTEFAESTGTLGSSTGGSDSVFQQEGYLYFPLDTAKYTSQYGWRNLGGNDYHTGDDFGVAVGSPVYASLTGKVVRDGLDMDKCTTGGGCNITIEGKLGNQDVRVAYLHLKAPSSLTYGDKVTAGQVIAYSGNTGNSTGPHLHVEVMIKENYSSLGLNVDRPIVSAMLPANELKGAKKEWWWNVALSWSRVKPSPYFKETEGVKASSQTISRSSNSVASNSNASAPTTSSTPSGTVSIKTKQTNYKSATGVAKASMSASTIEHPSDTLVIVNKTNKLSNTYVPSNMVNIIGVTRTNKNEKMVPVVATALNSLIVQASKAQIKVGVRSAYRSYSEQETAFNNNGKDETISAKAGYSEHQTGLAVDLVEASQVNESGTVALSASNAKTNHCMTGY